MPICEIDPWRLQYFEHVKTAALIPTEDSDAWQWYPQHRWVYDKLQVALSQNLDAGPHGTLPPRFPVFSKPIMNLKGMGAGSRVLNSAAEYEASFTPGHFWEPLLSGRHVSSDIAVVSGEPCWWGHVSGVPAGEGTFDYWTIHAEPDGEIEERCGAWIRKYLRGYTGMLNLETIGGTIIEAHLRFSDQWPDLYGAGWVEAVVQLYERRTWVFAAPKRHGGFSVVLFGPHGLQYRHPPAALVEDLKRTSGISSLQITFHERLPPERHAMPPGGFRLAVVNAFELAPALKVRERLRNYFFAQPPPQAG
ncbi:MAG TPA: hypothetical protein VN938_01615 [Xanthobacteraceae bacterium]|jgi:hypothetical protein|nr:hypothetical protein [Xanthobacteraceae bacterium]